MKNNPSEAKLHGEFESEVRICLSPQKTMKNDGKQLFLVQLPPRDLETLPSRVKIYGNFESDARFPPNWVFNIVF